MPNNTVVAPTSWITSVFMSFEKFNWGEIANAVEQKSLGGAISTAEHVAEAIAGAFASAGNPIAIGAQAVIPAAESIIGAVLNMIPALHPGVLQPPVAQPSLSPNAFLADPGTGDEPLDPDPAPAPKSSKK